MSWKCTLQTSLVLWTCCWGGLAFPELCLGQAGSLVGSPAPTWKNSQWINSRPLKIAGLKGKVVLVRFFTGPPCPLCRATAPALNRLHKQYGGKGLVVVGMYTPKPFPTHHPLSEVQRLVKAYRFEFPVAVDNDWATLKSFWLDRVPDATFTSVTFVIDREGIVRWVHTGGEFSPRSDRVRSRRDYEALRATIEDLLSRN